MQVKQIYEFKKQVDKDKIIFCYSGLISQRIIEEIGESLRKKIKDETNQRLKHLRVFTVFIEQIQNIMHYSAERISEEKEHKLANGIIIVGKTEKNCFYVLSGNLVKAEDKNYLTKKLEKIKMMEKTKLRQYYKDQLKKGERHLGGGAGLGLIEVARQASQPLEYGMHEMENGLTFFSIRAVI